MPGPRPLAGDVPGQEVSQPRLWTQVVEQIVCGEGGGDGRVHAIDRIVRDPGLQGALCNNLRDRWQHADGRRPHRRTALIAVGVDAGQECAAIGRLLEEGVEAAGVALARVALERGHEALRQ